MKAQILTPWTGDGSYFDPYRPLLMDVFPKVARCKDVTGQPGTELTPDPNLFIVEIECSAEVITQIEADPRFYSLWSQ